LNNALAECGGRVAASGRDMNERTGCDRKGVARTRIWSAKTAYGLLSLRSGIPSAFALSLFI